MRHRIVLVAAVLVLTLSGCSQGPKLPVASAEEIPPSVRALVEETPNTKNVVWRVCWKQDDYTVVVHTSEPKETHVLAPPGYGSVTWLLYRESGYPSFKGSGVFLSAREAWDRNLYSPWLGGSSGSSDDETRRCNIWACGWAFAKGAQRVVGTTSLGNSFETEIVDGFWVLLIPDQLGNEIFEQIVVKDGSGAVMHTAKRPVSRWDG